jgi:hypothetical protein
MRVRPWPIIIIALIHIFAPAFNIYFSAQLTHVPLLDYLEFLARNNQLAENVFWIILPLVTGFAILKFRKWSYVLLLCFTSATSILLLQEWVTSPKLPLETFLTLQAANLAIFVYFLLPSVRNVYLKPSLRWWEQKPRFLVDIPISIEINNSTATGTIKNISEGGALIETAMDFSRGDIFKMKFGMFQKKFTVETQVVFKGLEGFGTFFIDVSPSQNELNKVIDQLTIQGYPLRTARPNLKENFRHWMKDAIKGKGFVPRMETRGEAIIRSTPKSKSDR